MSDKYSTLAEQARRIIDLQAEIEARRTEIDGIKTSIIEAWPAGTYEAGDLKVQVKAGSQRIDAKAFETKYPASEHPTFYDVRPNLAKARKELGDVAVAPLLKRDKPGVVVK
jgi:hypothetical protein